MTGSSGAEPSGPPTTMEVVIDHFKHYPIIAETPDRMWKLSLGHAKNEKRVAVTQLGNLFQVFVYSKSVH
jgi:hypothetical protein